MSYFLQKANKSIKERGTKGVFSEWAKRKGMTSKQAASHVMANKEDYSPSRVKQANFAKNAMRSSGAMK